MTLDKSTLNTPFTEFAFNEHNFLDFYFILKYAVALLHFMMVEYYILY